MSCSTCSLCVARAAGQPVVRLDPLRFVTAPDTRPKAIVLKTTLARICADAYGASNGAIMMGELINYQKELNP